MTATLLAPTATALELTDAPQALPLFPREAYDDLAAWNASLLKLAITRTPAHAWAAYRDPNRPPQLSTAQFLIGSALHAMLLEPEAWEQQFTAVPPDAPKRPTEKQLTDGADSKPGTKIREAYEDAHRRKQWWDEFDTKAAGATVLAPGDYDLALALRDAVLAHPGLAPLFRPEHRELNELTLTWFDDATGHRCKVRIDALRWNGSELRVLDLKSAADAGPEPFGKSAAGFGYVLQGAFYSDAVDQCRDAIAQLLGLPVPAGALDDVPIVFEFVAIEKERPAPEFIGRYFLTDDQLLLGRQLYRRALEQVVAAQTLNYWPGYDTAPLPLQLPGWYDRKVEGVL
jgi:exodeoxyribonuclease VIII